MAGRAIVIIIIVIVGIGSVVGASLAGCASHPESASSSSSSPGAGASREDDQAPPPPAGSSSVRALTPNARSEPHRGTLAPPPASLAIGQFWPTRICTRGPGMIVVASNCVCDSKMTCSVARRGSTFDLHVGMSHEICKDCGTFMALCSVPAGSSGKAFRIAIDGKPVLDKLPIPRGDAPATEQCFE